MESRGRGSTKEIDSAFYELLEQKDSALSRSELDEVREYVDVGEYGIALRTYAAIFDEEKKMATVRERDLVRWLGVAMSIDPLPLLARMNR